MKVTHSVICAALASQSVQAFTLPHQQQQQQQQQQQRRSMTSLAVVGRGWDNDNFMDSLGKDDNDRERANDDYYRQSRFGRSTDNNDPVDDPVPNNDGQDLPAGDIAGAAITEEMKQKMRASHTPDEEASQGGQMFKKLLERAQQQGPNRPPPPIMPPPPPMPPPVPPQAYGVPGMPYGAPQQAYGGVPGMAYPPPPPIQGVPPMPVNFESLSVEEQARLFREMMAQQQPQQPPLANPYGAAPYGQVAAPYGQPAAAAYPGYYPPPPPPVVPPVNPANANYLAPGVATDGRKIGRNKDADAIVNAADLYFAQLKRDSTIRTLARQRGEYDKANEVFKDPSIEQIKMHINPYLQEQKEKELSMLETSADEMLFILDQQREQKLPKNYAGISYKEKLAQRQAEKEGKPVPPSLRELQAQQALEEAKRGQSPQDDDGVPQPIPAVPEEYVARFQQSPPPDYYGTAAVEPEITAPTEPQPPVEAVSMNPPAPVQSVATQPINMEETVSPEHVLTGNTHQDIRTLMGLILKHRGGPGFGVGRLQGTEAGKLQALAQAIPQVLRQEEQQQAPGSVVAAAPVAAAAVVPQDARLFGMIACIEGAATMYKNAPADLQGSVLVALRGALLTALHTLSQVLDNNSSSSAAPNMSMETPAAPATLSAEQNQKMQSMLAVIEGAITMYKHSPESLQSSVLMTLSAALMSAVHACNEILVVGSVTSSYSAPTHAAAAPETVSNVPATPQYSGNDANTIMLEGIYEKIKNAGGDGKMGLKSDLSAEEAQALQDALVDMRTILVDELHSGIPEGNASSSAAAADKAPSGNNVASSDAGSSNKGSSATSKYKQMLDKARAEKEAKDEFQ